MDPNVRHVEFASYNETLLNPLVLLLTLSMGILVLVLDRKYLIVPVMVVVTYVPFAQRIILGGLDFDMLRVIIIFWFMRMLIRKEEKNFLNLNEIDKAHFAYILIGSIIYILYYEVVAKIRGTGSVVNRVGFMFDAFGMYWMIRFAIQEFEDYALLVRSMVLLSIPIAGIMIYEQMTGRNLFSLLGGIAEYSIVRDGRVRSQGSFSHPILAGTYGASLLPLMWALMSYKAEYKKLGLLGIVVGMLIIITSASSGPILAFGAGMMAIYMWKYREDMKTIRGIIWSIILFFTIYFKGKPYELIWRISVVGGSTGYHRFRLIDEAVMRFREWAAFGVHSTAHWGWGLQDVTNQFILVAVRGGFLALLFFVMTLVFCFKNVGKVRGVLVGEVGKQKLMWSLAVYLIIHCTSFISVSYFGKMSFYYYLSIAIISSLRNKVLGIEKKYR